jgi:hypothetical protein
MGGAIAGEHLPSLARISHIIIASTSFTLQVKQGWLGQPDGSCTRLLKPCFISKEEQESKSQETISSFKSPSRQPANEKSDTKRYNSFAAAAWKPNVVTLQKAPRESERVESARTFRIGQDLLDSPFRPLPCREQDGKIRFSRYLAANRGGALRESDDPSLLRSISNISPHTLLNFKINTAEELPKDLNFDLRRKMMPPSSAALCIIVASGSATVYQSSWLRRNFERGALSIRTALLCDKMRLLMSVPQENVSRQEQQELRHPSFMMWSLGF